MTGEIIQSTKPEVNFYGPDVAQMLREDLKLVTLRLPNPKYDVLIPGEPAIAKCENENVEVHILHKLISPIKDIPVPLLLLDGYMSPQEAADDLKKYYPDVTLDTPVLLIELLSERSFNMFSPKIRQALTQLSPFDAVCSEICRPVYFPALARWLSFRNFEKPGSVWFNFLMDVNDGPADENEVLPVMQLWIHLNGVDDSITLEEFLNLPGCFNDLIQDPTDDRYHAAILLEYPDLDNKLF